MEHGLTRADVRSSNGLPTIIDVPVARFNAIAVAIGLVIAFGLVLSACLWIALMVAILEALEKFGDLARVVFAVFALGTFGAIVLVIVRAHRHYWLDRCVDGIRTGEFVKHLKFIVEHGRVDLHRAAPHWFVSRLVRRGVVGNAVRIDAWRKPTPIAPLVQQFEPRLILEGSDDFEQFLIDAADISGSASSNSNARDNDEHRENRSMRLTIGRNFNLFFALSLLAAASALFIAGGSLRGISILVGAAAGAGFTRMLVVHVARTSGKQWLAVPGGILIRKPRGFGTRSALHLMRRSNSLILATRQLTDAFWRVTISDGKLTAARTMSNNELVVALRAWTSELEPPALEHLSDWTGE